jgi:hypothetical protein
MFNGKKITTVCEHCGQGNVLNLALFAGAGAENVFENHVVATCELCKRDIIVELYESYIH